MPVRRRQAAKVGLSVAVLLAAIATWLLAPGSAAERHGAAAAAPSLRLIDSSPLRFAGRGFARGERVKVRASAGGVRRTRRVTAGRRGRFRVSFPAIAVDRCSGLLTATATGSEGNRASYKRAQPQCPPPLDPPTTRPPAEGGPQGQDPPADRCSAGGPGAERQCPPALRAPAA